LPRILHLQALPAMEFRVASNFASFNASSGEVPGIPATSLRLMRLPMSPRGRPGFCIFRPCRRWIFKSPRRIASFSASGAKALGHPSACSPVAPADDSPGLPGWIIFRLCRRWSLELPRVSHPSAPQGLTLQVSPRRCSSCCASRCWLRVAPHPSPSGFASG